MHSDSSKPGGETVPSRLQTISVIIPTLNERDALPETVRRIRRVPEISEVIVADGGSTDDTAQLAEQLGCRVVFSPSGRGRQLRRGAALASGDIVLLLHADTWLAPDAGRAVLDCLAHPHVGAGGFWKEFRDPPLLLLGSKWKCAVRLVIGRRIAGDQGLFLRRKLLEEIGGVPDVELMEDFELCRRLRRRGHLALAKSVVQTSARRFARRGVLRTYWRMWFVTFRYRMGTPASELRRLYDKE